LRPWDDGAWSHAVQITRGENDAEVEIELGDDAKTLTTTTTTSIFDATGALIATRCTTGSGTRAE